MAFGNTQIIPYSPAPPPPSSSSRSTQQFTYEVFLSFRGEDTRYGFTDHLYQALISHGIHTFRDDDELERGGVIASDLQKAIEESKIFVIILSPNYANSRWCLDELVEISQRQRLILPIFYHVDPSDVRKQTGSYEQAFVDHEKEANEEKMEKIQKWRIALMKVGNLAGYDLQKYRYETELIKDITNVILKELNSKLSLHVSNNMVGMNYHVEELNLLIEIESNDVRMIGIYGLGGVGKTTISKVVYNNIFNLFESSIFLGNVKERSQHYEGKLKLQKELLNGAIKGQNMEINSIDEGISLIKQRLGSKKVLLILDDVNKSEQLEFLAGKLGWFGPSSRIIITTRDQRLLKEHEMHGSYEVKCLDYDKSFQLFCQHAFKQNIPEKDFVDLSKGMVKYANGLPLALKVLGSSLRGSSVLQWESALQKLKTKPIGEVQNALKISFEGLDVIEQEIFLDIACFFKGCQESEVIRLVEHAMIGIKVLSEKSLITLRYNTIWMHDLVQEMGKDIVRGKHPKEPGKWSRLWDPEDISLVLRKKTGTEAIEGIFLDMSKLREIEFTTKAFRRMKRLRLFKVYWSCGFTYLMGREYPKLLIPHDFEFPSYDLRYLHWERYPLESLPSNFNGENLVELNLMKSNIKRLWQREKRCEKLQVLNIEYCKSLEKVDQSIGFLNNLTSLELGWCPKIKKLPRTIQGLVALQRLDLHGCENLSILPSSICKLKSLKHLDVSYCSKLKTFPELSENMECLKRLNLSLTGIREIPKSIKYLRNLTSLNLESCTELRSLSKNISRLKYLEYLNLSNCVSFESFPEITESMECLKLLYLHGAGIKGLPSSIKFLNNLHDIKLVGCKNLRTLPSSICKLESIGGLDLSNCLSLESFPEITEDMECLEDLYLNRRCINDNGCKNLRSLPSSCSKLESFPEIMEDMKCFAELDLSRTGIKELPDLYLNRGCINDLTYLTLNGCKNLRSLPSSIGKLKSLKNLSLIGCSKLESFPEIMEDMKCLEELDLSRTGIKELPSSIEKLRSLTCLVLSHCENLSCLPSSIGRLKLLEKLNLNGCPNLVIDGETASGLLCLSSLEVLDLSENNMLHIPPVVAQLCNLMILNISHCKMLEEIPELPSRLRELNIHDCPCLGTLSINPSTLLWSSLLEWCKKVELREHMQYDHEWRMINLGSIGIPVGWVQHQDMRFEIRIELPMNWYQDDHFLGFGFFCVHQSDIYNDVIHYDVIHLDLSFDEQYLFLGTLELPDCEYHGRHGSKSDELLLLYYPKIAIPDEYHSNQYVLFKGMGKFSSYMIHLIYSQDHQRNQDDEDNHMPMLPNLLENFDDNISTSQHPKRRRDDAKHNNQAKEPHHKRYLREPNIDFKF